MRRHITYTAAILLASTPAYADFVQSRIDEFFARGYTHFEVERGTVPAPSGAEPFIFLGSPYPNRFLST
jgi:hypothetical protein